VLFEVFVFEVLCVLHLGLASLWVVSVFALILLF